MGTKTVCRAHATNFASLTFWKTQVHITIINLKVMINNHGICSTKKHNLMFTRIFLMCELTKKECNICILNSVGYNKA